MNELLNAQEIQKILEEDRHTTRALAPSVLDYAIPSACIGLVTLCLSILALGRIIGRNFWMALLLFGGFAYFMYLITITIRNSQASKRLRVISPEVAADLEAGRTASEWSESQETILVVGPRWNLELSRESAIEIDRRMDQARRAGETGYPVYIFPPRTPGQSVAPTGSNVEITNRLRSEISSRRSIPPQ